MRRSPVHNRNVKTSAKVIVWTRADGHCEVCGLVVPFLGDWSAHHRLPGQMGGESDLAAYWHPSRLLVACGSGTTGCHGRIESRREWAEARGYLVRRPSPGVELPGWCERQSVTLWDGRRVHLTAAGSYREVA